MANNRAFLRCQECFDAGDPSCDYWILKYYPSHGWYVREDRIPGFAERLNEWLGKHIHGSMGGEYMTMVDEGSPPPPIGGNQ